MKAFVIISLAVASLLIVISMLRCGRFFSALVLTALEGIAALFAVDWAGSFIGVSLPVNGYTAAFCAIGGIPAVVFLLIADVILR